MPVVYVQIYGFRLTHTFSLLLLLHVVLAVVDWEFLLCNLTVEVTVD